METDTAAAAAAGGLGVTNRARIKTKSNPHKRTLAKIRKKAKHQALAPKKLRPDQN